MSEKPENPQAFPTLQSNEYAGQILAKDGMTLRDYFAAKAMQGYISGVRGSGDGIKSKEIVQSSYQMADAMLKERLQTKNHEK